MIDQLIDAGIKGQLKVGIETAVPKFAVMEPWPVEPKVFVMAIASAAEKP